ncbi:hypothetical protein [Streptomyces sp. M54]|uniref:hypothetical protein n=1 Tax=Streptomyces sp. M54 TaxID=2759525 RepID=UPI001A8CCD4D|nr:hypothetical protein [Streptomyces sp. M54]QSS89194.1 hypothetical protein H3V39_01210 [Streptomyces sp. M54]
MVSGFAGRPVVGEDLGEALVVEAVTSQVVVGSLFPLDQVLQCELILPAVGRESAQVMQSGRHRLTGGRMCAEPVAKVDGGIEVSPRSFRIDVVVGDARRRLKVEPQRPVVLGANRCAALSDVSVGTGVVADVDVKACQVQARDYAVRGVLCGLDCLFDEAASGRVAVGQACLETCGRQQQLGGRRAARLQDLYEAEGVLQELLVSAVGAAGSDLQHDPEGKVHQPAELLGRDPVREFQGAVEELGELGDPLRVGVLGWVGQGPLDLRRIPARGRCSADQVAPPG